MKVHVGAYIFDRGCFQCGLIPGIHIQKHYTGYCLSIDWLVFWIEIEFNKPKK